MDHIASLLLGLGNGGVFAALALALVLTYRSSGVVNFATGAIALYAAYTFAGLRQGYLLVLIPGLPKEVDLGGPMPVGPAALVALVLTAGLGAVLYLVVFRPLRDAPPLARAVASLGVLLVLQGLMSLRLGTAPVSVAPIFQVDQWKVGSVILLSDRFYLALTVVLITIGLAAVYRWTRFGLHTRAAAETETGAFVSGIAPDRIALANWVVSATVAGAAGILIAPLTPLTPVTYTLFVVPALAAAVVGGFRSVVPTVAAGLAIGMVQSEATSLAAKHDWMPQTGAAEMVPLIVILVALLATGRGMPARGTLVRVPLGRAPRPRRILLPAVLGSTVGVAALLMTEGSWRAAVIGSFIAGVIALSLVVVTGYAGQVSLAQLTLAGVGAFSLSWLTQSADVPFPLAPLLAALVSTIIGVVVGMPALRVRGLTLGVVTLALAYAIEAVWFRNTEIVSSQGAKVDDPSLLGLDLGIGTGDVFPRVEFGLLCLAVLVAVAIGVARLRTSRLGSEMLAVRANERSAAGIGVNVTMVKLASFAISSFIAGLGGSLLAYRRGTVTFDAYSTIGNLTLLSTAYLAGVTSVLGGVLAGLLAAGGLIFFATDRIVDLGSWFPIVSGALVIVTVIAHPEGLASGGHALAERLSRRSTGRGRTPSDHVDVTDAALASRAPSPLTIDLTSGRGDRVLDVRDLTVRYGGVTAVEEVSLQIDAGAIVGLIGPNGAGKTSVIDAVTGFAPSTGAVELVGRAVDGERPHRRVHEGLARTFQSLELYDDLTVEENVTAATGGAPRAERHDAMIRALELVGIAHLRDRPAGELSQGERQLVSIARACASGPRLLLLDEPAAGLDTTESRWLGERVRAIAASGVGVLLVDHDVGLVLSTCDHVYVLDFGRVIADGDAATIRTDRAVADAYLGHAHDAGDRVVTT